MKDRIEVSKIGSLIEITIIIIFTSIYGWIGGVLTVVGLILMGAITELIIKSGEHK